MPISHLTPRDASFPRLGKIKKGAPKEAGLKDLNYFRLDCDRSRVVSKFQEVYGNEPNEIRVWLPYQTVQENFDPWMKEYGSGSLKRQCDGVNQVVWLEGKSYRGVYNDDAPIPCMKRQNKTCQCKETGLLKVMVVELFQEGIIGYFDVETHSKWDIVTLQANLEAAYRLRPNLCGIPFVLRRSPQNISTPMGANRSRTEKWLLTIEPDATWVSKQFQEMYQSAIGASINPALPSSPNLFLEGTIDDDDEPEYLDEIEYRKLWNAAKSIGHDNDSARTVLNAIGIHSFTKIPRERIEEVESALTKGVPMIAPIPSLD